MEQSYNKELIFRKARKGDIPDIVEMLADDEIGSKREDYKVPLPTSYYDAFQNIFQDKNQELIILENLDKEIIGTLQLSFIQYLTYRGGLRAQIEAVRIQKKFRGKGFGKEIFKWAIKRSIDKGAHLVQLTTDKQRPDAIVLQSIRIPRQSYRNEIKSLVISYRVRITVSLKKGYGIEFENGKVYRIMVTNKEICIINLILNVELS